MKEIKEIIIDNEEDELLFFDRYNFDIYLRIIEGVEKIFDKQIEVLEIVRIINNNSGRTMVISIEKEKWENHLESCLRFFGSIEQFEICKKIITLKTNIIKSKR